MNWGQMRNMKEIDPNEAHFMLLCNTETDGRIWKESDEKRSARSSEVFVRPGINYAEVCHSPSNIPIFYLSWVKGVPSG